MSFGNTSSHGPTSPLHFVAFVLSLFTKDGQEDYPTILGEEIADPPRAPIHIEPELKQRIVKVREAVIPRRISRSEAFDNREKLWKSFEPQTVKPLVNLRFNVKFRNQNEGSRLPFNCRPAL